MRRIRVEHELTDTACLAKIIDSRTGDLIEQVISLDLNLNAGEPVIRGVLTWYSCCDNCDGRHEDSSGEFPTESEEVEVMYVDKFDQSQVANSE